jgi:sec-independent protein translocase protein TatB
MLRAMFGMGGSEILVILIVALLFLGPDKLPEAAKQISKGIRDIKKQSRVLQRTIEDDEHIGGAIRDLKSALRGEDEPVRPPPKPRNQILEPAIAAVALPEPGAPEPGTTPDPDRATQAIAEASLPPASSEAPEVRDAPEVRAAPEVRDAPDAAADQARPRLTMPATAGEPDDTVAATTEQDDAALAALVKPAPHTIPRSAPPAPEPVEPSEPKHG